MTTPKLTHLTLDKIEKALGISAYLVKAYGDEYLPVFQKIQSEREAFLRNEEDKQKALELAKSIKV